jgi:hypothetical protein
LTKSFSKCDWKHELPTTDRIFKQKTTQNRNQLITNKLHHIYYKPSLKTPFQQTLKTAFQAQKGSFEHAKA